MTSTVASEHHLNRAADQHDTRIGDHQRQRATDLLGQAFAQGYLDLFEYQTRLDQALGARTVASLQPALDDLPVRRIIRHDPSRILARHAAARRSVRLHLAAYLIVVLTCVATWLTIALTTNGTFFWPIWPALGGGIGVLAHTLAVRQYIHPRLR